MKRKVILFQYFILFLIVLFWCSNVFAYGLQYTSTGQVIKWDTDSVTYYINPSGGPSDSLTAIYYAMSTWTNVGSSNFTFAYGGSTTSTAHGTNNGYNIIDFGGGLESGTVAENATWYYTSTGYLIDSDIRFNTSYTWDTTGSASAMDVQNIATHEFGHSLKLTDLYSTTDSDKTMYYGGSYGETKKRTLDTDDMNGIAYLYPNDGSMPPSCPDLYSWDGSEYFNNGPIYVMSHCPERESYQERLVTQPVVAYNDTVLTFKIKELEDEISHINSFSMHYRNIDNGNEWKEMKLISAVDNNKRDVRDALKKKDNNRAYVAPGDEILLVYSVPIGRVETSEFKSIASGYYLWSDEIRCQILDLGSPVDVHPGMIVTFQARVNNMYVNALPEDAKIYFDIGEVQGEGYSKPKVASVSAESLAPGNPKWYSANWTVSDDVPPGKYVYSASIYIGEKNITWGDANYIPPGIEYMKEVKEVGASCH